MKYILLLLWIIYIIWAITVYIFFGNQEKETINIEDSIVIIIPENKIIDYSKNPGWLIQNYEQPWIWLWFFINNNWLIQTVNHIVKNDWNYKVIYKNKEYIAELFSKDPKKDLATIKINILNNSFLTFSNNLVNNESITSYWLNTKYLDLRKSNWYIINKKSSLADKSNLIEISTKLTPGFSGWPIINKNWQVIWINYANSNWKNYAISFK